MDRRKAPVLAALLMLAVIPSVCLVMMFERVEHLALLFLIPTMFLLGAVPMVLRVMRGTFDPFEVTVPYFIMYFLFYGAGALFVIFVKGAAYDGTVVGFLDPAVAYCTLGLACVMLGYHVTGRVVRAREEAPGPRLGWLTLAILYSAGYVGVLLSAQFDARPTQANLIVSGLTSLLTQLSFLSTLALFYVLFLVMTKQAEPPHLLLLFVWMVPTTFVALLLRVGNKTELITAALLPFISYWYAKRRLAWKSLAALVLVVIFVVFPFYYTYRNVGGVYRSESYRVGRAVGMLSKQQAGTYAENALTTVARRLAIINSTAVVIRDCGTRVEFENGRTLWLGVLSVAIPRFIWPDKPSTNIGQWFGKTFHITGFGDRSYVAISMAGELYWNFNVPGIVLGMFIMGIWMRVLYLRFGANGGRNPLRLSMYIVLLYATLMSCEGAIGGLEGALVKEGMILLLIEKGLILMQGIGERRTGTPARPSMAVMVR